MLHFWLHAGLPNPAGVRLNFDSLYGWHCSLLVHLFGHCVTVWDIASRLIINGSAHIIMWTNPRLLYLHIYTYSQNAVTLILTLHWALICPGGLTVYSKWITWGMVTSPFSRWVLPPPGFYIMGRACVWNDIAVTRAHVGSPVCAWI